MGSNLSNVSSEITGILNPGTFQNTTVDLRPWFNGSIPSTNLNNQAVGINWLDEGGIDPLHKYLNGETSDVSLTNTTNEYRLFSHFFFAFAHVFGCTLPPPPPPSTVGPLNLAYVHKYMNLNYSDLGYFIYQIAQASEHFGFSNQDEQTFDTQMNSLCNARCAPPITLNAAQGPQLLSLCQDPSCSLAAQNSDCAAYVNLTPDSHSGGSGPSSSSVTPLIMSFSSTSSTTFIASSSLTLALASTSAVTSTSSNATITPIDAISSSASLSSGSIAGIAVGGVVGLAILLGLVYFLARRQRQRHPDKSTVNYRPDTTTSVPWAASGGGKDLHMSYASQNGTVVVEMKSSISPTLGYTASSQRHSFASPVPVKLEDSASYGDPSALASRQHQHFP